MDPMLGETVHFRGAMEIAGQSIFAALVTSVKPGGVVGLNVFPPGGSLQAHWDVPRGGAGEPGTWFRPGEGASTPVAPAQPEGAAAS
jgi:hypothetical protein